MFIIQGLLNTPSLVLYGSKNRLKTCERFALLDRRIPMRGARLTNLLPFYRMRRLISYIIGTLALTYFSPVFNYIWKPVIATQMSGFYTKCNTELKSVKLVYFNNNF